MENPSGPEPQSNRICTPVEMFVPENSPLKPEELMHTHEILDAWIVGKESERNAGRDDGAGFNPYSKISIREIDHSRLIGELLNTQGSHGQGSLFLNVLLRHLNLPEEEKIGDWKISVETGRVDIMLWTETPEKFVVLIENKSNNAIDQQNQIYRYWYEQIYRWDEEAWNSTSREVDMDRRQRYRVIYLATDKEREPMPHSLQCPETLKPLNLPLTLPLKPQTVTLSELTQLWIDHSYSQVPESNTRLRSFLTQYHEIWNPMSDHNMMGKSVEIFKCPDRWNAFFQVQDEIENIIEHWRLIGARAVRTHFELDPSPGWVCDIWGSPTNEKDTRWYLKELGPESIGIGFGWPEMELDLFFHWKALKNYDVQLVVNVLNSAEFEKLRVLFPDNAYGSERAEEGCFAADKSFTPYPEANNPITRRRVFAWHAAHDSENFAAEIAKKVKNIIEDKEIIDLIRKLNHLALKSDPVASLGARQVSKEQLLASVS